MKKTMIGFCSLFISIMLLCAAIALPLVKSRSTLDQVRYINNFNGCEARKIIQGLLFDVQHGIIDRIIDFLNSTIAIIQSLIKVLSSLITIVELLQNVFNALSMLVDEIQELIQLITNLFNPVTSAVNKEFSLTMVLEGSYGI